MHEISLANRIREELGDKDFTSIELAVGLVSIHDNQHSRDSLKKMLSDLFPGKKIEIKFAPPELSCACGHTKKISGGAECEKCGKRMKLELHEGYQILSMEK